MKLGYIRVSTHEQRPDRQIAGLEALCDELHVEKLSAVSASRPVFDALIARLEPGDTLVIWDLDRAFRSTVDALIEAEGLRARGVGFQIVSLQVDTAIRDIFKARYEQTMNQMREGLIERESQLKAVCGDQALAHARSIEKLIAEGETMPFYRAYDQASASLAETLGITQAGAKTMMKDAYRTAESRELYETGKALEEQHHRPRAEAARAAAEAAPERPRQRRR